MKRQAFVAFMLLLAGTTIASAQSSGAPPANAGSQTLQAIDRAVQTLNQVSDRAIRAKVESQRQIGEADKAIARETDPAAKKSLQEIRTRLRNVEKVADEQLDLVRGARKVADGPVGEKFDQAFQKLGKLDAYLRTINEVTPDSTRRELESSLNQHLYHARIQAADATSQLTLQFVMDFSTGLARFAAELSGADAVYRTATGRTLDGDETSRLDAALGLLEMYMFGKVLGKIARGENPLHGELVVPGTGRGAMPTGGAPVPVRPQPPVKPVVEPPPASAPPARTATGTPASTAAGGTTVLEPPAGGAPVPGRPTFPGSTTVFEPPPPGAKTPPGASNPGATASGSRTAVETPGGATVAEGASTGAGPRMGTGPSALEYGRIYEGNYKASQQQQLAAAAREGVPNLDALKDMSPRDILSFRLQHAGLEMTFDEASRMLGISARAWKGSLTANDMEFLRALSADWRRRHPTGPDYLDSLRSRGPVMKDGFTPLLTPADIRQLREGSGIGSEKLQDIINRVRTGGRPALVQPTVRPPLPPPDSGTRPPKDDKVPPPAPPVEPAPVRPPSSGGAKTGSASLPASPAAAGSATIGVIGQLPSSGVPPLEFTITPGSDVIDETVTRTVTMPKALDLVNYTGDLTFGGAGRNPMMQAMMIDAVNLRVPVPGSVGGMNRSLPAPSSSFGLRSLWNLLRRPAAPAALANRAWADTTRLSASPRAQRNGNRDGASAVKIFLSSLGSSTGEAFDIRIVNQGNEPIQISGDGLVVEPLDAKGQSGARREMQTPSLRSATAARLNAYCLEFLRQPPSPGTLFKIASQDLQQKFAPTRQILQAARRLEDLGLLNPDSNPLEYFHSIKQWAVWAKEQQFDAKTFGRAFMEHAKKNIKAAGRDWTREIEDAVLAAVPGRWQDIARVLEAAKPQ